MTWTYIFILAAIVFFNRYLFLEPRVDIKFPHFFEKINFKIKSMDFKDEEVVFEVENME